MNEKRAEIADARNSAGLLNSEIEELEAMLVEAEERKIRANEAFNEARGSLQSVSKEVRAMCQVSGYLVSLICFLLS